MPWLVIYTSECILTKAVHWGWAQCMTTDQSEGANPAGNSRCFNMEMMSDLNIEIMLGLCWKWKLNWPSTIHVEKMSDFHIWHVDKTCVQSDRGIDVTFSHGINVYTSNAYLTHLWTPLNRREAFLCAVMLYVDINNTTCDGKWHILCNSRKDFYSQLQHHLQTNRMIHCWFECISHNIKIIIGSVNMVLHGTDEKL
jgi:hypothetical protein